MSKTRYLACIMCGKTVAESRFNAAPFEISPIDFIVLQVRQAVGGRKGQGFYNIPEEGKTILDMWNGRDPREREIVDVLKERLLDVMRSYIENGIITKEEI